MFLGYGVPDFGRPQDVDIQGVQVELRWSSAIRTTARPMTYIFLVMGKGRA